VSVVTRPKQVLNARCIPALSKGTDWKCYNSRAQQPYLEDIALGALTANFFVPVKFFLTLHIYKLSRVQKVVKNQFCTYVLYLG